MDQVAGIFSASAVWLLVILARSSSTSICPYEAESPGGVRLVILDLDAGGADGWALTMLLMNEKEYNICVLAITCTHGNVDGHDVVVNFWPILDAMGRLYVPVYLGASEPLITPLPEQQDSQGYDRFGDVSLGAKPVNSVPQEEHAVNKMNELLRTYPNKISLVSVGTLTNIALLYKMYPEVKDKIAGLYILGGNRHGVGNTAFAAELNIFRDPEAAHIVLNNSPVTVNVFPWEEVVSLRSQFSATWRSEAFRETPNPAIQLLNKVESEITAGEEGWTPCGMYVVAAFLNNAIMQSVTNHRATVELTGQTRGMMAILHHITDSTQHNVAIIDTIDADEVRRMFLSLNIEKTLA